MTRCLEERERHTHWMVFREESPTTSPYWLSLNIYPVLWLDLLVLIQVSYIDHSIHFLILHSPGVQLLVETSPQSLALGNHSLICTVRLTVGGQITPQPISIQWIELDCSNKSEILADCNETVKSFRQLCCEHQQHIPCPLLPLHS